MSSWLADLAETRFLACLGHVMIVLCTLRNEDCPVPAAHSEAVLHGTFTLMGYSWRCFECQ